jgi:hypothetical protein
VGQDGDGYRTEVYLYNERLEEDWGTLEDGLGKHRILGRRGSSVSSVLL